MLSFYHENPKKKSRPKREEGTGSQRRKAPGRHEMKDSSANSQPIQQGDSHKE